MEFVGPIYEELRAASSRLSIDIAQSSNRGAGTSQEVADFREGPLRQELAKFYPAPYHITKGKILAVDGALSCSIDSVILNPAHPKLTNAEGKFSYLLADAVDLALDAKGYVEDSELRRFFEQAQSVKSALRSKSPRFDPLETYEIAMNRDSGETESIRRRKRLHDDAARRIPFFGYATSAVEAPLLAQKWSERATPLSPLSRPNALFVHRTGALFDTSAPDSPGEQILEGETPPGLYWVESGDDTLAVALKAMDSTTPSVSQWSGPILPRYLADTINQYSCLYEYEPHGEEDLSVLAR